VVPIFIDCRATAGECAYGRKSVDIGVCSWVETKMHL